MGWLIKNLFRLCVFATASLGLIAEDAGKTTNAKGKATSVKQREITLAVGVSRTLSFDFTVGPVHQTDSSLYTFSRVKPTALLLVPKSPGFTDMTVHDSSGTPRVRFLVRVTREEIGEIMSQLESLIGDIEGIKIKAVGGTVIIDGEILLPSNMLRIIRVVKALRDRDPKKKAIPIKNVASISKLTMKIIAERIEREIGSPEVTVRVLNNNLVLEGTAANNFEADRAIEIAKTYLPEVFREAGKGELGEVQPKRERGGASGTPVIIDLLRVAPAATTPPANDVLLTVQYVKLQKEYKNTFQFSWRPLAQEQGTVSFNSTLGEISSNLVATVSSLFPKLVTAKEHAHARVLRTEQLIVKDGATEPGAIETSLDFWVRNVNERGEASLQPIQVQNATRIKAASIAGSDSLELGIQITLQSLVGTQQGAPIISKNSIQTQITIKNGDSAAIGGSSVNRALAGYNREPTPRVPGVGETSGGSTALFNLNRSKNFQRDKGQFVIFVTPEIIQTAAAGTPNITRKFRLNAGE